MKKNVTIARTHIYLGKKSECRKCPAAIALQAHVKPNVDVSVGHAFGFWIGGWEHGHLLETPIPEKLHSWVSKYDSNYDSNYHMEPITFEVEIPNEAAA